MKAGLMEIADVFVVNKADRPDADTFVKNLRLMLAPAFSTHKNEIPVVKTIAAQKQGLKELVQGMEKQFQYTKNSDKRFWLLAEKTYQLVQNKRMKNVNKAQLKDEIATLYQTGNFNLYRFAAAHC
jgi:LAO/AO transport system kinase